MEIVSYTHRCTIRKLASLIFIGLLLANISWLGATIEPVSGASSLTLKWTRYLGADAITEISPLAADLVGDSRREIVVTGGSYVGDTDGPVTVLDGSTGNVIWQVAPGGVGSKTPFDIADIDSDGSLEIFVSGLYPVVLRSNGDIFWKNTAVSSFNLWSAIYDIDADGYSEIFVSSGKGPFQGYDYFTKLSYDGKILAQNPTSWHPCWGGLTIGDANYDGVFELYQGDRCYGYTTSPTPAEPYIHGEWGIRCLDANTLTPLWNDSAIICSSHPPILADVDKDGMLDVIATHQGTSNGGLIVLNASSGSVLTTGGKYRKSLSLGLPSHSAPTVYDIDGDGNLEIITCRNTNPKIWDLYDWKLDAVLPIVCSEPPKVGDVNGDGQMEIIAASGGSIYIYDKNYNQVDLVTGLHSPRPFTTLQDVDGDNHDELLVSSSQGYVYCFDTPTLSPNPSVRSELQFYSERHCGAAEFVPRPGPPAPVISTPSPTDVATNIPVATSTLSFNLTDFQHDKINCTVTTTPNIGGQTWTNVANGRYSLPISTLDYSKLYTWQVTATDGVNSDSEIFTFTTQPPLPWWDSDWQYRKKITIDPSKVASDQVDFPVAVDLTDSGLIGKVQDDGDDFVFTDENNVKLDHELELYDPATGHLVAWAKVPYLSSTIDTIFYLYYGNPAASNQENPAAVWDTSYRMVLHLNETAGDQYDSTANSNDGKPYGGIAQGSASKIAGGDLFDGVNDYVQVSHSDTLTGYTEAFTASFWLKLQDTTRRQAILNKYNTVGSQRGWYIEFQTHPNYGKVLGFFASQDGINYREWYASFNPTPGSWYYVTVVWQANMIPKFYVDGAQVLTRGILTLASIFNNVGAPLDIGRSTYTTGRNLAGGLDEIRLSNPVRSATYILTCFNNQKDPSAFYQIGSEETLPHTPVIASPYPADGAIGLDLNPTLAITATDYDDDPLTIVFRTNATGEWTDIGTYNNVPSGTYNQITTNLNSYSTQYWWSIHVSDGTSWINQTYTFTTKPEPAVWWNTDWQYRKIITIDPSQVSSDQTDFPVVVDFTDSDFTAKAQTNGDDFVFTDESNVKLSHEIEVYDYATGHLTGWVNVPLVSSTTETILYLYYGNPTAPNQEDPMAVWDTSYKLVMHLSETHECRMWGMIANSLPHDTVLDQLINLPYSLEALSSSNRDGWGIVYYAGTDPTVLRGPLPAYLDPNYDVAVNQLADSGAWIGVAHIRARSSGGIPPYGNPHPFMRFKDGKWWAFSHNGNLNKETLKSLIGAEYLAANPPTYGSSWDSSDAIDSDLYELYVLKCIEANNWNVPVGIAQAVTDITKLDSGGANFLLTDGITLWGFRKGNTLEYYYSSQYSAVASQHPTSTTSGWVSLTDYNLITLTKGNPPSIISDIRTQYPLLVDSPLSNSIDSADLRNNATSQDWYESRNDDPNLLFLDTANIGGNTGKKAGFTASSSKNAYLTQEFKSAQTGTFSAQWDIYVDSILDISGNPDRAGFMLIGDNSGGTNGPNSADGERFVFLAFNKTGGGTSGTADLVWMDTFSIFTPIASVNLDQWYTIKVVVNVVADTYDVYLNGTFIATVSACTAKTSVTHISFAQWNDGAGAFYVDNIYSPTADRYRLTASVNGDGSMSIDPAESSYTNGSSVTLTAIPNSGAMFTGWTGDISGTANPITITMDSDKIVVASFTQLLLADPEFSDSVDSADLRNNTAPQDWYESRVDVPTLLTLDNNNIGNNTGKKAGFTGSPTGNAYLSQEFSSAQTGVFTVQWDIYVDEILDIPSANPDRAGWMMIGDDSGGTGGPNNPGTERFVLMAFYKDGGGTSGTMDLVVRQRGAGWTAFTTVASGLYLKQWYMIKVVCDLAADTYDIYLNGAYTATVTSYTTKTSVTHISFAQWNDGAGTFYVDNVFAPPVERYRLTVNVVGDGSVAVDKGESTYLAGTEVTLTATADPGFVFAGWDGDLVDHVNPVTIVMDSDRVVTATFIVPQYTLTIDTVGSGIVTKNPDKPSYEYGETVELTASPSVGWSFSYWSGDLSGSDTPTTITMTGDKFVIARFTQDGACVDSTANGNDGLLYGGVTQGATGIIDGAYQFDGVNDYIQVSHSDTLTGYTEAFTASFWLKLQDTTRRQAILNKYNTAGNQRGWYIEFQTHSTLGKVLGFFASQDGVNYREWYASFNPAADAWYYIAVVWATGAVPKFYVNGAQVSTIGTSTLASIFNNVGAPLYIGRSYTTGRYLAGSLDEIRLSNPTRSASYILTSFNNQKDPSAFCQIGPEESLPTEPMISDPYPADGATSIPLTLAELNFTLTDYQGDLLDYYVSTSPDIGGDSATGVTDGTFSVAVSGLQYQTTYTWHVDVTDGTHWTNRTFTFTTVSELLVDSQLSDSSDSDDLRTNSPEQDWYESRGGWSGGVPTLLYLDTSDVGGNTGKKAGFTASTSGNAYLSQEFNPIQTSVFSVQWDIYVDSILDISSPDRAGIMLIGSDLDLQKGPSSVDAERFVFLAFFKNGGATSGLADLVAMSTFSSYTTIASGLNLKEWHTIKVVVNVTAGNYEVYVNGEFKATVNAATKLSSLTHVSFAQWNDGAGAFYIDNVYASTVKQHTLTVNIVGNGLVQKDPDQATYPEATEVNLTAIANLGWEFTEWSGDATGTENTTTITMDSNKTVTATFTKLNEAPVVSNPEPSDTETGVSISTSLLNFTVSDADGDSMDYYLSTSPDIGSGTQTGMPDGKYSLAVSGLAYETTYTWRVNVTDGSLWTNMSFTFTTQGLNAAPEVSNPEPADSATDVPISTSQLNFTIADIDGDLMDYYLSTTPDIGSSSQTGVNDGTYSLPVSGLVYGTAYQWWVNVTDGTNWTNMSYAFTTESPLLVDSEFDDSTDSADLRTNATTQDWYESRIDDPTILFLDENNVGGNAGKKAGFTANAVDNAYLSQEFSSAQTGVFSVQWDIYVDNIVDISGTDATGFMMIGDDITPASPGPNYPTAERFVYMAFYKNGGGASGTMELFCRQRGTDTRTTIATLNMDQWYTIRLVVNVTAGNYDVYVDGTFMGTYTSRNAKTSVTHISFAQWNDGAGAFYVDNVFAPAVDRYKLTVSVDGAGGSVVVDPAESSYSSGASVELTAVPVAGWSFSGWSGDLSTTDNPTTITMDSDKTVVASFTKLNEAPVVSSPEPSDTATAVPISTSLLNFTTSDADSDLMSYYWATFPDVGFGSQTGVGDGTYSLAVSGLTYGTTYTWWVNVTDGTDWTNKSYSFTTETLNAAPEISNPEPTNGTTSVSVSVSSLNFTISDAESESMDYYVSTLPNIGSDIQTGKTNGTYSLAVTGLAYGTTYTWWVNVTDNNQWTNKSYTFTTEQPLLTDSEFTDSVDSDALRANNTSAQDWYESRGQNANLLTLDTADVGGNSGKKARLSGTNSSTENAYLTQEFIAAQTGTFSVQWDIYVDSIFDLSGTTPDRSGIMMMGTSNVNGPNRADAVRFVFLAFYKNGGGTEGTADLVAMSAFGSFTTVASGLNLDQWYTIKVNVNVAAKTYDVYVDGVYKGSYAAVTAWAQSAITHISFAQWNDGAGTFYVDNVFAPAVDRYKLIVNLDGSGNVDVNPAESSYGNGTEVTLTANADSGWIFAGWSGDISTTDNPATITMDGDKNVTATFTKLNEAPIVSGPEPSDTATGVVISTSLLNFTLSDSDGDLMTYYASTLPDVGSDSQTDVGNGTYGLAVTGLAYETTYTWWINVTDGSLWTNMSYTFTTEGLNAAPVVSNPEPVDGATGVLVSTSLLNFTIGDTDGDLMDCYLSTTPNTGSDIKIGLSDGTYSLAVSGLSYGTAYQWWVNVTDGTNWTNTSYTFTTEPFLLLDSKFNDSVDSADLRTNGAGQDWYESRAQVGYTTLLYLDEMNVSGNTGKKGGFTASSSGNAYLSQNFISTQTGVFSVQWDIYIDSIVDISGTDRAGWMLIGDDSGGTNGPNSARLERFVYMGFYRNGGGTSGTMDLIAKNASDSNFANQAVLASGLNLKQWYTIKVVCNIAAKTFDLYIDGVFITTVVVTYAGTGITHISFAQWNDGAGAFYVDNVFAPAVGTYKLAVSTGGHGSVTVDPGESSYVFGAVVSLTPVADSGYVFDHWEISGVPVGSDDPYLVTMDSDKTVTAFFRVQS